MATITMSLSGSGIVNGSKNYTISDADLRQLLDWGADAFFRRRVNPDGSAPGTPTDTQVLLAWIQAWIDQTKSGVQSFKTVPAVTPPQIVIA